MIVGEDPNWTGLSTPCCISDPLGDAGHVPDRIMRDQYPPHSEGCRCIDGSPSRQGHTGATGEISPLSCEQVGHCYVVDVVSSKGTLRCNRCDYSQDIGIFRPK